MNSLPGERILLQSDNKSLILTSHRVRFEMQTTGLARVTSIMLEEISACEITTTTKPWLLVAALAVFIGGMVSQQILRDSSGVVGGIVIALIFVVAYFSSREGVISLRSSGGSIQMATRKMTTAVAKNFIDAVEAAKNERFFAVRRAAAASA